MRANWCSFFEASDVTMVLDEGRVKELTATPPPSLDRVPVAETNRQAIVDPLTAMLFSAAFTGEGLSQGACRHTLPIFDGHQRYDLKLAFKRMDKVTAEKGNAVPRMTALEVRWHQENELLRPTHSGRGQPE